MQCHVTVSDSMQDKCEYIELSAISMVSLLSDLMETTAISVRSGSTLRMVVARHIIAVAKHKQEFIIYHF